MEEKFKRFLELSNKFTKSQEDVLGKDVPYTINRDITINGYSVLSSKPQIATILSSNEKIKTTSELILESAKEKAQLADEYDEYLKLQKDLQEYFKAVDKLNK